MICPICGKLINSVTDEVILKWYEPGKWWVFYHLKLTAPLDPRYENEAVYQVGDPSSKFRSYCAQARFNPTTGNFN